VAMAMQRRGKELLAWLVLLLTKSDVKVRLGNTILLSQKKYNSRNI